MNTHIDTHPARRGDRRMRRYSSAAIALGCSLIGMARASISQVAEPEPIVQSQKLPRELRLQCHLFRAEQLARSLPPARRQTELRDRGITMRADGRIHVEIVGPPSSPPVSAEFLAAYGAVVDSTWRHRLDGWVPFDQLINVGRALPEGYFMERAVMPRRCDVAGQGPAAINSDSYRDGGANGDGVTMAIIDGGFDELTESQADGDSPPANQVSRYNHTGSGFESSSDGSHGTSCTEVAYDHCPGAYWHLFKVDSLTDLGNAVDTCINYGVDVISHSLNWPNTGWADDSGDACEAARSAGNAGITFVTSAGNYADTHWQGNYFAGSGDPDWHDWVLGDPANTISGVTPGTKLSITLQWRPHSGLDAYDLDLYLFDENGTELHNSNNPGDIYEDIEWTNNSQSNKVVRVRVRRDSNENTEFELFVHVDGSIGGMEYTVPSSSTGSPANTVNGRVVVVGAVHHSDFNSAMGTSGIIEPFSSYGPTNGGRQLPDLCGPDGTATFTHPTGFFGTSGATPNVAGALGCLMSAYPAMNTDGIRWLLTEMTGLHRDWGVPGSSNDQIYGVGGAFLIDYLPDRTWLARNYGNTTNQSDLPFFTLGAAQSAVAPGGRITVFPGSYPEPTFVNTSASIDLVTTAVTFGH